MPTAYQIKDQELAYYMTFQVVYWIDIFSRETYRNIVIQSLKYCQQKKGLEIFAYVIMSNHVHILARSATGDLSGTIRDFKKFTSRQIVDEIRDGRESRKEWMLRLFAHAAKRQNKLGHYQVWTHENHAVMVYSNTFIEQRVKYIHNNPVRNGLVDNPWEYKYSSARNYCDMEGVIDIIPVSFNVKAL